MQLDWYNIAERAGWTFVQAFVAAFVVTDLSSWKVAAAAGVAAVLSFLKTVAQEKLSD